MWQALHSHLLFWPLWHCITTYLFERRKSQTDVFLRTHLSQAFMLLLVASGTVGISLGDRPGGHLTHVLGSWGSMPGDMWHMSWGLLACMSVFTVFKDTAWTLTVSWFKNIQSRWSLTSNSISLSNRWWHSALVLCISRGAQCIFSINLAHDRASTNAKRNIRALHKVCQVPTGWWPPPIVFFHQSASNVVFWSQCLSDCESRRNQDSLPTVSNSVCLRLIAGNRSLRIGGLVLDGLTCLHLQLCATEWLSIVHVRWLVLNGLTWHRRI